ncbi:MAG: hypothetical protein ABJA62_01595 [Luteimonas sp.]
MQVRCNVVTLMLSLLVAITVVPQADATDLILNRYRNPAALCQGALPNYEGSFRKRPMAIANEGSTSAFITCSLESTNSVSYGQSYVSAAFVNRGTSTTNVSCTMVAGGTFTPAPIFFTKSINVGASGTGVIAWTQAEVGARMGLASLSCNLPAAVEIGTILDAYPFNIGA